MAFVFISTFQGKGVCICVCVSVSVYVSLAIFFLGQAYLFPLYTFLGMLIRHTPNISVICFYFLELIFLQFQILLNIFLNPSVFESSILFSSVQYWLAQEANMIFPFLFPMINFILHCWTWRLLK